MPTCQYCNSELSTKSSLKVHQRTSKKCLKVQGIEPEINFECDICNKKFLNKVNLQTHKYTCIKKSKNILDKNIEIDSKYNEQLKINIDLQKKLLEIETKYTSLVFHLNEKYNMIVNEKKLLEVKYDNLLDKITNSAISKTNNTVNKNIVNISTYTRTDDEIKNIYDRNITSSHIEGGISCIAKLIVDKVITDDNGNKMITITDKSRGTAKYKLPSGEVITDVGLNTFTNKNRDMVMKRIYNVCMNPELSSQILDEDTRLCQGYNEISDDNEGEYLKRNIIKNIG